MPDTKDKLGNGTRASPPVPPATVRLDAIEDRFVRRWHRYRWELRETTRCWIAEQGLLSDKAIEAHTDDLLCYTDLVAGYYVGASTATVQAIADFSVWFFIWDDRHSVHARRRMDRQWRALSAALRRALQQPTRHRAHPEPLVAAFADAVSRFRGHLGQTWDERFTEHMNGIFDAYDREYRNLISNTVPSVLEYLELRRWTFGHDVWIDLLELAAGCALPPAIHTHEVYQRAAHASQEFSSAYNDLCSMPKEIIAGDIHNLGICLMRHEGLDVTQAQSAVRDHAAECVGRFLEAEREIPSVRDCTRWPHHVEMAVQSCVFNMRNWISSVYWFHHESGRYRMQDWADPAWPPYVDNGGVS